MALFAWLKIFPFLLCITQAELKNISISCKLKNDNNGSCIQLKYCPNYEKNNTDCRYGKDLVCCTVLEKIVTPNAETLNAESSIYQPNIVIPPNLPIIEQTTRIDSTTQTSIAIFKCEEYKHRLIKRATITTYVFGGVKSLAKEFPHMAALGYGPKTNIQWLCGGSLISEQWIVTAAHCVSSKNLKVSWVRLGDLDLHSNTDDAKPQDFSVIQKVTHPDYKPPSEYNDIALLKLDRRVEFNEYVSPICLLTTYNLPNTNFITTGWGKTSLEGPTSNSLMKVNLFYYPREICNLNYELAAKENLLFGILDESQLCAGSPLGDKDTCQGDSGGPLQIQNNNVPYLVGITSFGKSCGTPDSPGVYTRISYFAAWIEKIVW